MILEPIQWLIDFLVCLVIYAVGLLLAGLMALVNLLLAGLMALLGPLLALLPDVDLGDVSMPDSVAAANWVFPLTEFVALLGIVLTLLAVWHIVAVALRWLKVVE